jgi:hypothetical protein
MPKHSDRLILALALPFLLSSSCFAAAEIKVLRIKEYNDHVRIVMDISGEVNYQADRLGDYIQIRLPDAKLGPKFVLPSLKGIETVGKLETAELPDGARLYISLRRPSFSNIFPLVSPSRIVIDLRKDLKEFIRQQVSDGMTFIRIAKPTEAGPVTADILLVDPRLYDIFPVLAEGGKAKEEGGFLGGVFGFFGRIFSGEEEQPHFYKETTSAMEKRGGGMAAVNGTYFGKAGEPLGILVINGELVTYPVYDRTALVISSDGTPSIDNVYVETNVDSPDGYKLKIDGFNGFRASNNDTMIYTDRFGGRTGTKDTVEMVVRKGMVEEVTNGNSGIPESGFVISCGNDIAATAKEHFKPGSAADLKIDLMPYSTDHSSSLKHLIGGGPRLLKGGRSYVSKKEEKFKRDIATARAARTAVGITRDGKLIFVAVDKTSRIKAMNGITESVGMQLEELSELLRFFGAVDAMNLDGGGSSTMIVSGEVVNVPANGHEIAVSNAIVIKGRTN